MSQLILVFMVFMFWNTFGLADDKILVRIETKDRVIIVFESSEGKRYTLKTRSGDLLADALDEKTLLHERPLEHAFIKSALAKHHVFLDASVGDANHSPSGH